MSLNKKILAAAIVGSLFATAAQAQVLISATPSVPVLYAQEIISAPGAGAVTLAAVTANSIRSALGFNFSVNQTLYVRIACSAHVNMTVATTDVTVTGGGIPTPGSVNGSGTNVISFGVTAPIGAGLASTDTVTVGGTRSITSTAAGTCGYSLHATAFEAAGGISGIASTGQKSYLAVAPSYLFTATSLTSTASADAVPSYAGFAGPTFSGSGSATTANLAGLTYGLVGTVPLDVGGAAITLATLMATGATGTRIAVSGDFTAAANGDGTYTGAALSRVFISAGAGNCTLGTGANTVTATTATFNVGATAVAGLNLCFTPLAAVAIPAADYTALLNAVSATPASYAVSNIGPRVAGSIVRDGTELQAPLAQVPSGWMSRIVLTNTGGTARPYTMTFTPSSAGTISEPGSTYTGALTSSGTVPANGLLVLRVGDLFPASGFGTTPTRGMINVTIAGPNKQIQGLYQLVNAATGGVSNHVMVRPGSN